MRQGMVQGMVQGLSLHYFSFSKKASMLFNKTDGGLTSVISKDNLLWRNMVQGLSLHYFYFPCTIFRQKSRCL